MVKGDNTPYGGGICPYKPPQMPLFSLVLYILYYSTAIASGGSTALQMAFMRICKKVKYFRNNIKPKWYI